MTERALRLLAVPLLLLGCGSPPASPEWDRRSVRVMGSGFGMDVDLEDAEDSGPFPALDVTYSHMVAGQGPRSTELELGIRRLELDGGSGFEGVANGYLLGGRWTFRRDRRLQPVGTLGTTWTRFNFTDRDNDADFSGPGVYGGGGWQYLLTPRWVLGLEARLHLQHWDGHRYTSWATSADVGLSLAFRF